MSNLLSTFVLAFILILLALLGLMISWLVKGQTFKGGTCGKRPKQSKNESCGTAENSCVVCNPKAYKTETDKSREESDDDCD